MHKKMDWWKIKATHTFEEVCGFSRPIVDWEKDDALRETFNDGDSICREDFAGNNSQMGFWADWDGKIVVFGGAWRHVPTWETTTQPSEDELCEYTQKYGGAFIAIHIRSILDAMEDGLPYWKDAEKTYGIDNEKKNKKTRKR